jgi:response regulator RpfG family c-di-GMP phosphodiesterase
MVDDEPNILAGFKRDLRGELDLKLANNGPEGLEKVESDGPFAVIVSDYKMPQMNGNEFLAEVRKVSPTTVGMLLTGFADLDTAIEAVHKGRIFRLLTKPCPKEVLLEAIDAGIEQHNLINAEKVLLEKTLTGSVKVLSEVLSLANPQAFGRGLRVRGYVKHICGRLGLQDSWEFEMAAHLSQLGCVTFPPHLMEKVYHGEKLTVKEREIYLGYAGISAGLIEKIPRLNSIAEMIRSLDKTFRRSFDGDDFNLEDRVALGGYLLKVAIEVDALHTRKIAIEVIIARLPQHIDPFYPEIKAALQDLQFLKAREVVKSVRVADVTRAMKFHEDVYATDGLLLVSEGQEANFAIISRLRNFAMGIGVVQPFKVSIEN